MELFLVTQLVSGGVRNPTQVTLALKPGFVLFHFAAQENSSSGENIYQQLCYCALVSFLPSP